MKYLVVILLFCLCGCQTEQEKIIEKAQQEIADLKAKRARQQLVESLTPDIGPISLKDSRTGCHAYTEITPKRSGFNHRVEVKFVFRDDDGGVLDMFRWMMNHPVAGQSEVIEGWTHEYRCKEVSRVGVSAKAH